MKIEKVALSKLKPLENNVRKHNDKQIEELIRSLNQFGQTRAIVIDEANNILIGNGLYEAMVKRGDTHADIHRMEGLTETQKKKLVLSDNKIFSLGIDDYEGIQSYINEIVEDGDYDIAGFDDDVLKELTRSAEEVIDDVMNYGVNTAVSGEANTPSYSPVETESVPQSVNNAPQYTNAAPVVNDNVPRQEVKNDRTIVCPNCGEVIHID